MNFNEFPSMKPIYWCGNHSDVEILVMLSCHGNAMLYIERILRLREQGCSYANQQFDVLHSALSYLHRN